jgi:D-alanyl-D-alanine dipeptidase
MTGAEGFVHREIYSEESWAGGPIYTRERPLWVSSRMNIALQAMLVSLKNFNPTLQVLVVAAYRERKVQEEILFKKDPSVGKTSTHSTGNAVAVCLARNGIPLVPLHEIINTFFAAGPKRQLQNVSAFQEFIEPLRRYAQEAGLVINTQKFWHLECSDAKTSPIIHFPNAEQHLLRSR